MWLLRLLNKLLGAIVFLILAAPWIILATAASCFLLLDAFPRIRLSNLLSAPFKPILVLILGAYVSLFEGWQKGIYQFITSSPTRIWHFFTKQIPFGLKRDESVRALFRFPTNPAGIDPLIPPGFFGRIVTKCLSLTSSMDIYIAYAAGNAHVHNDVNIYFTEKVLRTLKEKYHEASRLSNTLQVISAFLENKKQGLRLRLEAQLALPEAANIESVRFELEQVNAALRCVQRLEDTNETASQISRDISTPSVQGLCYVWHAIETEGLPQSQEGLKDKLILSLYQIQRGYNIASGSGGPDLPECPLGSLGLLMRVVVNEPDRMPGNTYEAADPSPANLTEALKATLDRPFATSSADIKRSLDAQTIAHEYSNNPEQYREKQKNLIRTYWKTEYRELIRNNVLQEENIDAIIDAGVDAWEPPALRRG